MKITSKIHAINLPFVVLTPSGPISRSVNVFLYCGASITLIDSGVAGSEHHVFAYLEKMGLRPEDIRHLILTHSHPDHVGAAKAIQAASGCRVSAHIAERNWIEDTALQEKERPVPGFHTLVGGSVPVNQLLHDGDSVLLDQGAALEVIHTPGHSAGSVSLWCPSEKALVTGDAVLLPGDMPIFDDYRAAVDSLKKLEQIETEWLLAAWDEPRRGAEVKTVLRESLQWLEKIHQGVHKVYGVSGNSDPMALCREMVAKMALPPFAANPLVARSFISCLAE